MQSAYRAARPNAYHAAIPVSIAMHVERCCLALLQAERTELSRLVKLLDSGKRDSDKRAADAELKLESLQSETTARFKENRQQVRGHCRPAVLRWLAACATSETCPYGGDRFRTLSVHGMCGAGGCLSV